MTVVRHLLLFLLILNSQDGSSASERSTRRRLGAAWRRRSYENDQDLARNQRGFSAGARQDLPYRELKHFVYRTTY